MTLRSQPFPVQAAAAHLLASAHYTKNGGDPFEMLTKKFGDHTAEVLKKLGASEQELTEHRARLAELEQRAVRGGGGGPGEIETIGRRFSENSEIKTFSEYRARPTRFSMNIKATITSGAASGGALTAAHRDETASLPQQRLTVRDLLPTIQISEGSVDYAKQKTRTNAAGMVAEGAAKPESEYAFELVNVPVRTIAHWVPASRQILDDAPQLRGLIDTELLYGLKLKEESQLLLGDGTGQNLMGLIPSATAYVAPITVASPNSIDLLGLAILQNALANYPADGIVVNAADWMRMRLIKDADGNYILGDPAKDAAKMLFGVPVVDTPAIPVDKFLVGNFQVAATLYDRWDARIEVSTEHADFFTRNLVAVLCEERVALAVKRPAALTYGDFGLVE